MGDKVKKLTRYSSHETFRSVVTEGRYESLRSIERLLENDMNELLRTRRTSLPLLQIRIYEHWSRRPSTLTDYLHELTTVKSKVIHGILPNLTDNDLSSNDRLKSTDNSYYQNWNASSPATKEVDTENRKNKMFSPITDDKNIQVDLADMSSPEHDTDVADKNSPDERTGHILDHDQVHHQRMSIHDDDFQNFLGIRYLEICSKKGQSKITASPISQERTPSLHLNVRTDPIVLQKEQKLKTLNSEERKGNRSHVLNARLHALATRRKVNLHYRSNCRAKTISMNSKTMLPPILSGRGISQNHRRESAYGTLTRVLQDDVSSGAFVAPCSVSLHKARLGVSPHTGIRATDRYTGQLHTLLGKFRDLSSVACKEEQENFTSKLNE